MMRHGRHGGRSQKRPVQWVASTGGYGTAAAQTLTVSTLAGAVLAGTSPDVTAETSLDIDRLTVMRIMGDLLVESVVGTNPASAVLSVGVCVADVVQGTADLWDPAAQNMAAKPWMYLRSFLVSNAQAAGIGEGNSGYTDPQAFQPSGMHFDIRVKRILRPQQRLFMMFKYVEQSGNHLTLRVTPFLRTLVARAI